MSKFKKCGKCKEEKSLDCFYLNKSGKYGVRSDCKLCRRIYAKEYYSKNKENLNKYRREYHIKNKENINKIGMIYNKKQIEQLGDPYITRLITQRTDLTKADIPSELIEAKRLEIKIKRIIKEE